MKTVLEAVEAVLAALEVPAEYEGHAAIARALARALDAGADEKTAGRLQAVLNDVIKAVPRSSEAADGSFAALKVLRGGA